MRDTHQLLISSIAKHTPLTETDCRHITDAFRIKAYQTTESVLQTGEICHYDFFVNSGCLRSFYTDPRGKEHTIQLAIRGWWTGNLKSLLTKTPSLFSIETLLEAEVLRVEREDLDRLYEKVPSLNTYFRIILQRNLISTQDRVIGHLSEPATTRWAIFQKRFPALDQQVDQKIIASYLGVTPAYLSRLKKRVK